MSAAPVIRPLDAVERPLRRLSMVQMCLRQLDALLGPMPGQVGLDLGGWGGVISAALRRRGGTWCSMEAPGPAFDSLRRRCDGEHTHPIERVELPFDDQVFDVVVVIDLLQHARDSDALVQEFHRVLKPAGRLIVQAPFLRAGSFAPALGRMVGIRDPWASRLRAGYTRAQLFAALKNGFDVQDSRVYGRPFSHLLDLALRAAAVRSSGVEGAIHDAWARQAQRWGWACWPAAFADALLPLSHGHRIIVRAKRRLWIPRRTPVLRDGRSIAEATLQTRIGSASVLSQITARRENTQIRTRR